MLRAAFYLTVCFVTAAAALSGRKCLAGDDDVKRNLTSVYFVDEDHGVAVGIKGTIMATADGGETWELRESGTNRNLNCVTFNGDGTAGYVAGDGGTILKTSDGGETWEELGSGTKKNLRAAAVAGDGSAVYAVGDGGVVLKYYDGAGEWPVLDTGVEKRLTGVSFPEDGVTGYAVGQEGLVIKTTDGGESWNQQDTGVKSDLLTVSFPEGAEVGYAGGRSGTLLKTTNGGETWIQADPSLKKSGITVMSLSFVDDKTGYAALENMYLLKTGNGGQTWAKSKGYIGIKFASVHFPVGERTGYAAGNSGVILKTEDSAESWDLMNPEGKELNYSLHDDEELGSGGGDDSAGKGTKRKLNEECVKAMCGSPRVRTYKNMDGVVLIENEGDTPDDAIVICNATVENGVAAEYLYIGKRMSLERVKGWKFKEQSLFKSDGRMMDKMEIELPNGGEKTFYFDISDFFGDFSVEKKDYGCNK